MRSSTGRVDQLKETHALCFSTTSIALLSRMVGYNRATAAAAAAAAPSAASFPVGGGDAQEVEPPYGEEYEDVPWQVHVARKIPPTAEQLKELDCRL